MSANAAGTAFLAIEDTLRCPVIRTAQGPMHGWLQLTGAPPDPARCGRAPGRFVEFASMVAADGTALLAYVQQLGGGFTRVAFGSVAVDGSIDGGVTPLSHRHHAGLQLAVDPNGRGTLVWWADRDSVTVGRHIQYADFGDGRPPVSGDVSLDVGPVRKLGLPTLVAAPDGTQTVSDQGFALVDGVLRAGSVSQARSGPDTAWSDPVLVS